MKLPFDPKAICQVDFLQAEWLTVTERLSALPREIPEDNFEAFKTDWEDREAIEAALFSLPSRHETDTAFKMAVIANQISAGVQAERVARLFARAQPDLERFRFASLR